MALSFCTPSTIVCTSEETSDDQVNISTSALDFLSALATSKIDIFTSGDLRLDDIAFRVAGRGGYASIEIGVARLPRKRLVAVKRSLIRSDQSLADPINSKTLLGRGFEHVIRELRILGHDSIRYHDNLVNLEGVCMDDFNGFPSLAIVMEYSKFGTLRQFLVENADNTSLDERIGFVAQSARGLDALHQVRVCHADIKIDNALVFKASAKNPNADSWVIRLSDFGQSIIASRDDPDGRVACRSGTPLLEAPEIRRGQAFSDPDYNIYAALRTDIFSFGLFTWEVINNGRTYFDPAWIRPSGRQVDIEMEDFLNDLPEDGLLSYATTFARNLDQKDISEQLLFLFDGTLRDQPQARKSVTDLMSLLTPRDEFDESDAASGRSIDIEAILATIGIEDKLFSNSSIASWGSSSSFYDLDLQSTLFGSNSIMSGLPVSLQRNILAELKIMALSDKPQDHLAGHAAITISECYTAGFGGSHDTTQVVQWLETSVSKSFHKARMIYHRVRHAVGMTPHDIKGAEDGKDLELALEHVPTEDYMSERIVQRARMVINSTQGAILQVPSLRAEQHTYSSNAMKMESIELSIFNEAQVDQLLPIHIASWLGDEALVAQLLETSQPDAQSQLGFNALHFACLGGHLKILKLLIDHGVPVSKSHFRSITPLHLAIFFPPSDLPSTVHLLLNHGSSLEVRSQTINWDAHDLSIHGTPMEWALESRNRTLVRLLLPLHVHSPNPVWLMIAIRNFYWEILEDLLPYFQQWSDDFSDRIVTLHVSHKPFLHWIAHGKNLGDAIKKTVQICNDNGFLGFSTDGTSHLSLLMDSLRTTGDFLMFNAALDASSDEIVRSRRHGFFNDPVIVTAFQNTAYKHAFHDTLVKLTGYYTISELENGQMSIGGSLLGEAVMHHNILGARVLLEKGVDVNKPFVISNVIATNATQECLAARCSPEMLSLLVKHGADLLAKSPMTGLTPLHALLVGRMQVRDILDILSKRDQPDRVYVEALHRSFGTLLLSSMKYNDGVVTSKEGGKESQLRNDLREQFCQLLLDSKFKNFIDHPQHADGPTMIQQAAYMIHPFTVRLLLEAGADPGRPLRRDGCMILPLELTCIMGRGLQATKVAGMKQAEVLSCITMCQVIDVATELLQFHQARGDNLFEGITELHLASRMLCEEEIAKCIARGQSMSAKGRWPGVEYMVTPRELALLPLHDDVGISYNDLIPSFQDELLGEQAIELLDIVREEIESSEDSSSLHTDDLDY